MRTAAVALALALLAADARAQPVEDEAAVRYREGARLLQEGQAEQALVELRRSEAIRPSPNARLLEGHALRTLGRRVEALAAYEDAVATAGARVREGEARYEATVADAGRWVAVLKTQLGEVTVEVRHGSGSALTLDRVALAPTVDTAGTLHARAWHEPGTATVSVLAPDGRVREVTATVVAGAATPVGLELAAPPATAAAPRPQPTAPAAAAGPPVAAYVAFGASALFLGLGAVFLAESDRHSNALDSCFPHCDPNGPAGDHRSAGKRDEILAAVGGGAALVALGVGVVLLRVRPSASAPSVALGFGPGGADVRGAF